MKITLKLFATLTEFLPPGTRGNVAEIEIDDDASVGEVIAQLRLPEKLVHLVLVNGDYVAPAERSARRFIAADQLAIWPPIAGG